jgi:hypothetical protein
MFLASLIEAPRWAITEDEANTLATGFSRFARWYDFPDIPEKWTDHYAFFLALATVYGTRAMAEWNDSRKRRMPQPPIVTVQPEPTPGPTTNGREPPDPRNWRQQDVEGFGPVDIPPVTGNIN